MTPSETGIILLKIAAIWLLGFPVMLGFYVKIYKPDFSEDTLFGIALIWPVTLPFLILYQTGKFLGEAFSE